MSTVQLLDARPNILLRRAGNTGFQIGPQVPRRRIIPQIYELQWRHGDSVPQAGQGSYEVADANGEIDFHRLTDEENLYIAYEHLRRGGKGAGIDGVRVDQIIKRGVYAALRQARNLLRDGTYLPRPTLPLSIAKRDGSVRTLQIPILVDRCVSKAVSLAYREFWTLQMPLGFQNVWDVMSMIHRAVQNGQNWIMINDIETCYDSVPTERVIEVQRQYIRPERMGNLAATIARGNQGRNRTRGVDQGNPYSPTLVEAFLCETLDSPIRTSRDNVTLARYVDNIAICAGNERECIEATQNCINALQIHEMRLKHSVQKWNLRRVRSNDRPNLLGYTISTRNGQLVIDAPDGWLETLMSNIRMDMDMAEHSPVIKCEERLISVFSYYACIPENRATQLWDEVQRRLNRLSLYGINWPKIELSTRRRRLVWEALIGSR